VYPHVYPISFHVCEKNQIVSSCCGRETCSNRSDRPPGYLGLVWKRCAFHASFQGGGSGSGGRGGAGAGGRGSGSGSGGGTNGPMGRVWIMFPEKYWKEILESRIWHTIST